MKLISVLLLCIILSSCDSGQQFDVLIQNGMIYDGSGEPAYAASVGIKGDTITAIGDLPNARGTLVIDAKGMAISPGFVNFLSWGIESMVVDGRAVNDIMQGITLEVQGEGESMGPITDEDRDAYTIEGLDGQPIQAEWNTLGEYFDFLENRGVSPNIASHVGAATVRAFELGYENRPPTEEELDRMRELVHQAMHDGAVGLGSALMYPPGIYASSDELVALAEVAAQYGGLYSSHLRIVPENIFSGFDEFLDIVEQTGIDGHLYHFTIGPKRYWHLFDELVQRTEAARAQGLKIKGDILLYTLGHTQARFMLPAWVHEGGGEALMERLGNPETRTRIKADMEQALKEGKANFYTLGPDNLIYADFSNPDLKPYIGKTVAELATLREVTGPEVVMDLFLENDGVEGVFIYVNMHSQDQTREKMNLPWLSFCTDHLTYSIEEPGSKNAHPRAFGSFPRVLGQYVREEKLLSLTEAIRRMTSLPTEELKIRKRGRLKESYYADIVIFDPDTIQDQATYEEPNQYSTGVEHVFVNGVQVVRNGVHTGALPGRAVRGPGWTGHTHKE